MRPIIMSIFQKDILQEQKRFMKHISNIFCKKSGKLIRVNPEINLYWTGKQMAKALQAEPDKGPKNYQEAKPFKF